MRKNIIWLCLLLMLSACAVQREGYYFADEEIDPSFYNNPDDFYAALAATDKQRDLIEFGKKYLGTRYVYGGESPRRGFDCSGFTQYVYAEALGLTLPRSTKEMVMVGEGVSPQKLRPGDLIFLDLDGDRLSHVGIYIGQGKFFHASRQKRKMVIADLHNEYFSKRFNSARRVL